ncbi:unnamed protein product [Vitrella brassicaformis CCMP3155]|uniref:Derlin n=3 Tax=Vitrella brassicaformis TaxID=1169539 RepID=A0A0G4FJW5_VITBC|nr:unnamed protein product [Vitrella brassicaformis CCMP3155]|mmetsp:Transcript_35297/g.87661  ORF Transcript_35297/g.87661 Transcript_35297/m.87661 type:complete len:214 (+) Transcript_35297:278-919(+)|eukprot:CEM14003.1 unnamed protein product [Vitrella brassicaformis CCMP3155]
MVQLDELLGSLPPVTKSYVILSTGLMLLCSLDILSPYSLYLNWNLIKEGQVWRLVTCFLFFGNFGLHFFWNQYVLVFYCSNLEDVAFRSKSADFLWMLIVTGSLLLGISYFFGSTYFFASSMIDVMTYIWGRRNPNTRMHFLLFTIRAPYVSWVLLGMSLALGWQLHDHLMGIIVGHLYYFFEDVYPLMPTAKGWRLFRTPSLLKRVLREAED